MNLGQALLVQLGRRAGSSHSTGDCRRGRLSGCGLSTGDCRNVGDGQFLPDRELIRIGDRIGGDDQGKATSISVKLLGDLAERITWPDRLVPAMQKRNLQEQHEAIEGEEGSQASQAEAEKEQGA